MPERASEPASPSHHLIPDAVVGLVDIIASSRLSNSLDLSADWEIRVGFLKAATVRAHQTGMRVLNHTGDGFLFLANDIHADQWDSHLLNFYEMLASDFRALVRTKESLLRNIETGLRLGVTSGPGIIGCLGGSNGSMTVVGPEANLAARLCALAGVDEIVVSSRAWRKMSSTLSGQIIKHESYSGLKGFDQTIPAVHLSLNSQPVLFWDQPRIAQAS